jgi:predicted helicase
MHIGGRQTQMFPLHTFDENGNRLENITDWGLQQFCKHYKAKPKVVKTSKDSGATDAISSGKNHPYEYAQPHLDKNKNEDLHEPEVAYGNYISKEDIFHYVYAVLHNPAYRKKYELNLKREFPRIPFYKNFQQWSDCGKALIELHINYENVNSFALKTVANNEKENPKAKLKADKESGAIAIDENTTLTGVPKEAWLYKLGNRSALEWVLDQYKESKPKDPTIAEKFNTYIFADYKNQVLDLLKQVCTVSVETMKIVEWMKNE